MVNPSHTDFPALLAEPFDRLAASDWDIAPVASLLSVTSSQLVKFLKLESRAVTLLNVQRGQRPLQ